MSSINKRSTTMHILLALLFPLLASAQWKRISTLPNEPFFALQQQGNILYAATYDRIYRSGDGGNTWVAMTSVHDNPEDEITDLIALGDTLYAATLLQGCHRSTNKGQSWTVINNGLTGLGSLNIAALAVRGDLVFAATLGSGVFARSRSATQPVWQSYGSAQPWGNVQSLSVDGSVLMAGAGGNATLSRNVAGSNTRSELKFDRFSGEINAFLGAVRDSNVLAGVGYLGLYRSTDGGLSWSGQPTGVGFIERAAFARFQGKLYVLMSKAASHHLRSSTDRGETWTLPADNLPSTAGRGFDLMAHQNRLFCALENGLWVLNPTVSNDEPPRSALSSLRVFPNPATNTAWFSFVLPENGQVEITLSDAAGRRVLHNHLGWQMAGNQQHPIDLSTLPKGIYSCTFAVNGRWQKSEKLTIL